MFLFQDVEITPQGLAYYAENDEWLLEQFKRFSVSVFGATGTGKDLIFAHQIALSGAPHYANLAYDYNTILCPMGLFQVGENTYKDVFNRKIKPITNHIIDGINAYVSDGAIAVPNVSDAQLKSDMPGLHIYAALRRQLNDLQIHLNAQTFERLYIIYREQCDCFIWTKGADIFNDFIIVHTITYDNKRAAEGRVLPGTEASGEVEYRDFLIMKSELHYNSRAFRKEFYKNNGEPSRQTQLLKEFLRYE